MITTNLFKIFYPFNYYIELMIDFYWGKNKNNVYFTEQDVNLIDGTK